MSFSSLAQQGFPSPMGLEKGALEETFLSDLLSSPLWWADNINKTSFLTDFEVQAFVYT